MRDIRAYLQERLDDLDRERAELLSQIKALEAHRTLVEALLQSEEERFGNLETPPNRGTSALVSEIRPMRNVSGLMRKFLADGNQLTTQQLTELAVSSGYRFGDKSPRRSVHFALVGLEKGGLVKHGEAGDWCLANGAGGTP